MNFSKADLIELKRQNKLVHTVPISEREKKEYENRNPYQRDYARILYSSSFRRLQGKMQVLGIDSTAFFRNRLTHSLEVAQIAKGIRWELDKQLFPRRKESDPSDLFLLDAAALAHDIGHPAFGHKGERVLDELARDYGLRFEGNAQNFRVIRILESKSTLYAGLNLTTRTLLAINKYLIPDIPYKKKFMYQEDYDYLNAIREKNELSRVRSLDVQIIELADDIAYAVHDLEDAVAEGYISIDELVYDIGVEDSATGEYTEQELLEARKQLKKIVSEVRTKINHGKSNNQEYSKMFLKCLTSTLTSKFINDIGLYTVSEKEASEHGTMNGVIELSLTKYKVLCKLLSKKIFKAITRRPEIAIYEQRGEIVLKSLFNVLTDIKYNRDGQLFPLEFRPQHKAGESSGFIERQYAKTAIDYLAGMMDNFAMSQYERLFNCNFNNIPLL